MDRARARRAEGPRFCGGTLRSFAVAAVLTAVTIGCGILNPDFDPIIALEVETQDLTLQVGDSVQLVARAVNGAGDVVTEAVILWSIIDVDSGQTGFSLDTATGMLRGQQAGAGRVQARVQDIRSQPIFVTVVADSTVAPAPTARRATIRPQRYTSAVTIQRSVRRSDLRALQVRTDIRSAVTASIPTRPSIE